MSRGKVTQEEALDAVRKFAREKGRAPYLSEWRRERRSPAHSTLRRLFPEGWDSMLARAGLQPPPKSTGNRYIARTPEQIAADDEIVRKVIALMDTGKPYAAAGAKFGWDFYTTRNRVTEYRRRHGMPPGRKGHPTAQELEAMQLADPSRDPDSSRVMGTLG